jgi:hypothetical protein
MNKHFRLKNLSYFARRECDCCLPDYFELYHFIDENGEVEFEQMPLYSYDDIKLECLCRYTGDGDNLKDRYYYGDEDDEWMDKMMNDLGITFETEGEE